MNTIFAASRRAAQSTGLVQVETLAQLSTLTGVPAVEWLECSAESPQERADRLERLADVLLSMDPDKARRAAALHRVVLEEPAVIEIEDPVFGPVRVAEPRVRAVGVMIIGKSRSGMGTNTMAALRATSRELEEVRAA
ncbi:hypothetical protein ACIHCQ_42335 [Streptomyces sp. NPDC052236]|uniref:hypothetical protein n=1 Tax=Streptomyces sp. NPDC052236 TaxID=3365686 RepID=UPI0037D4F9C9